ncbi:MAG: TetR/AcrR family transcriptional regulator [Rhodospirillales bacterium]|nr:TetR/AcrR family transcriptional regulator [Rhodospirillales bacterium]MDE2200397.1 TetR/AcrR family transcriptional regulator [Rhodospirillales bacterium]MDE2576145.1 TetR/AcrR family transcriptional regulator [Rhodospirillales bacterium]
MARTRALDYAEKRDVILRRSAQLFARHGYTGTSISMIAEACGVSKALLYHYYPDKEAVLFDILHSHLGELVARAEAVAGATAPGAPLLLAMGEALLDVYRDSHAEHQVQLANLHLLPDERQAILRQLERRLVDIAAGAIAAALPDIAGTAALKPLTMSWFGMINWHYLWFREGRGLSRGAYARLASHLILSGGEAAARRALGPMA